MNKNGAMKANVWLLIGLGVVVALYFGWLKIPGMSTGGTPPPPGNDDGALPCTISDTTLALSAVDFYAPTTSLGSSKERLILSTKDGVVDKGNVSNGGTTTTSPLDGITVYFAKDSQFNEADGIGGTLYYTEKKVSPGAKSATDSRCTGSFPMQGNLKKNGSISFTFYNSDGTAGSAEAMTTDSTYNVEFQLKAPANAGYGNPDPECANKNLVCIAHNSSFNSLNLGNAPKVPPTKLISDAYTATTGNGTIDCWNFDPLYNNEKKMFDLEVQTGSTGTLDGGSSMPVLIDDCDLDLNADNGQEIWGLEDEDRNNLGATYQFVGSILVS